MRYGPIKATDAPLTGKTTEARTLKHDTYKRNKKLAIRSGRKENLTNLAEINVVHEVTAAGRRGGVPEIPEHSERLR